MSKLFINKFWNPLILKLSVFKTNFREYKNFNNAIIFNILNFKQKYPKLNNQQFTIFSLISNRFQQKLIFIKFISLTFLIAEKEFTYRNAFEIEKEISKIVTEAEILAKKRKFNEAKILLKTALDIADKTKIYSNISSVYDLISTILLQEGEILEAENLLVSFIENLIQFGYPENHNSIIGFKLKLSRLYQATGNYQMAELGYKDCINAQENKINNKNKFFDEQTKSIYVSSLFWYGNMLYNNEEYSKSKIYLQKALNQIKTSSILSPSQIMVVLYLNADVCIRLHEYNQALEYLHNAIDICHSQDSNNPDLPFYLIKVGTVYMHKGLYKDANLWCTNARDLAKKLNDILAETKANSCIKKLEKLKSKNQKV